MIFNHQSQASPRKGSLGIAMIFFIIAIVGVMMTISSPAEKSESKEIDKSSIEELQTDQFKKTNYSVYFLRVIIITAGIIVVVLLGSRWYRRKMRFGNSNKVEMNILSRQYLSPKHSLIMVGVEGRRFLLGITENSINLISESEDKNETENEENSINEEIDMQEHSAEQAKVDSDDSFDTVLKKRTNL